MRQRATPIDFNFATLSELEEWLKAARNFNRIDVDMQDEPEVYEWLRNFKVPGGKEETHILYIHKNVFSDEGDIRPMTPASWKDEYVRYTRIQPQPKPKLPSKSKAGFDDMDDDIPF